MVTVNEGDLLNVEYISIKTLETVGGKVVVDSDQSYSLVTLGNGYTFQLSVNGGREVKALGIGRRLKGTQDKGTITVEAM